MRRIVPLFVATFLLLSAQQSIAETIYMMNFNVTDQFGDPLTASGTIHFDSTIGNITSSALFVKDSHGNTFAMPSIPNETGLGTNWRFKEAGSSLYFSPITRIPNGGTLGWQSGNSSFPPFADISYELPGGGAAAQQLFRISSNPSNSENFGYYLLGEDGDRLIGTAAPVPEPTSLVLAAGFMGTLGFIGVWKRRNREKPEAGRCRQ